MRELRELIGQKIRTSGPISFAEFMELSLYHPEFGYYARAAQVTGRPGDFFTSVDVGALFGELLAKQFAEMWRFMHADPTERSESRGESFDLVEAGAGNGRLARDVLDAAQRIDASFYSSIRLSLVEVSPAARAAHVATLGPHAALLKQSSSALPDNICGVIFANELLDALPTHAVMMTENGLREVFVDLSNDGRFIERLQDPSSPRMTEYLSRAGVRLEKSSHRWRGSQRGPWRAEVNLAAEDWVTHAAKSLMKGFLIVIDYGHEDAELYGSSHSSGTLTTFKRHTSTSAAESASTLEETPFRAVEEAAVAQPFRAVTAESLLQGCLQDPGECDITAHVDLTAITRAAERSGLNVLGRLDQTYFMLGLAMENLQEMSKREQTFEGTMLQRRLALKTLLLPGGLGSTHKVLIFGKDVGTPSLKGCSYRVRLT